MNLDVCDIWWSAVPFLYCHILGNAFGIWGAHQKAIYILQKGGNLGKLNISKAMEEMQESTSLKL